MAIQVDVKPFAGGLDQDTDIRFVENGKYIDAQNIRIGMSVDGRGRVLTNLLGVADITDVSVNDYNAGTCIGMFSDEKENNIYLFYANYSSTYGRIIKYDVDTDSYSIICHSNSTLNFSTSHPILSVNIIENLMFWTDGYNPPRKINVYTSDNVNITAESQLSVIKAPPNSAPSITISTDDTFGGNNIKDKFFQFKYRFVYADNEKSVYSPISSPAYSPLDYLSSDEQDAINTYNVIQITCSTDNASDDLLSIEIVGREGNTGDFKFITDIDPSVSTIYNFYNNGIYSSIPLSESNQIYDDVPQLAMAQTIAENRLIYGNVLTGYDKESATLIPTIIYNDQPTSGVDVLGTSADRGALSSGAGLEAAITTIMGYTPLPGDILRCQGVSALDIPFGTVDVLIGIGWTYQGIVNEILSYTFTDCEVSMMGECVDPRRTYKNDSFKFSTIVTGHEKTFKSGSWYDAAIEYFDSFGRTNGAIDPVRFYVKTLGERELSNGDKSYAGKSSIALEITSTPPSWAKYYTILYSRATTIQDSVYTSVIEGAYVSDISTNDRIVINIDAINTHREDYETSKLAYSFEPGDRVRFINLNDGASQTEHTDFAEEFIDLEIISSGSDMNGDKGVGTAGAQWISIPAIAALNINTIDNALIEIYTPGKVLDSDENIFFETNKFYPITDGAHEGDTNQVLTGLVSSTSTVAGFAYSGTQRYIDVAYGSDRFPKDTDVITVAGATTDTDKNGTYIIDGSPEFFEEYARFAVTATGGQTWTSGTEMATLTNAATDAGSAIVILDEGDAYHRTRKMYSDASGNVNNRFPYWIESYSVGDFSVNSQQSAIGRPSAIINQSQQQRFATCFYSESFIPNTDINNLNRFYPDVNFEEYGREHGAIWKLFKENDGLIMIQENKTSRILVNRAVTYDASGAARNLQTANVVLSTSIPYQGEYGIQEGSALSFVSHGGAKYWVDLYRGMGVRLSRDGISQISDYGMKGFFRNICKSSIVNSSRIYGMFDPVHSEYRISFAQGSKAILFSEQDNVWVSFIPDDIFIAATTCRMRSFYSNSSKLCEINRTDVSNGQIEDRDEGTVNRDIMVQVVCNSEPVLVKNFMSITLDGNSAMDVTIDTEEGQQALTYIADFVERETEFQAPIFRDINTPNVSNPAFSGNTIKGKEAKIKLSLDDAIGDFYLKTLGVVISRG